MTHGDLGLEGVVCGFSPNDAWLPPFYIGFFFFFFSFPFFFLVTCFLVLLVSPSEKEEGEGEINEVEGGGETSGLSGC